MQPRSKLVASIGATILVGIVLVSSVQATIATPVESPKESYLSNVNYAAGISMGMAVSRAFTSGEPFSDGFKKWSLSYLKPIAWITRSKF